MPEDTGGLTGPLGGTGELYVTGSLKLPKSLGETGGHSSLHDSIEFDPITGAATEDPQTTGQGPAPGALGTPRRERPHGLQHSRRRETHQGTQ